MNVSGLITGSVEITGELHLEAVSSNVSDFLCVMVPLAASLASASGKYCEVLSSVVFAVKDSRCRSTDLLLLCTFLQVT